MFWGVIGIAIGCACGLYFPGYFPEHLSPYMAIALIASFDTIVGGLRSKFAGDYDEKIFISGFFLNAVLAVLLTMFGKQINLQLDLAATVVFVMRIFQNFAYLRRNLLNLG